MIQKLSPRQIMHYSGALIIVALIMFWLYLYFIATSDNTLLYWTVGGSIVIVSSITYQVEHWHKVSARSVDPRLFIEIYDNETKFALMTLVRFRQARINYWVEKKELARIIRYHWDALKKCYQRSTQGVIIYQQQPNQAQLIEYDFRARDNLSDDMARESIVIIDEAAFIDRIAQQLTTGTIEELLALQRETISRQEYEQQLFDL